MSWVAVAVTVVSVGTAAYTQDQQRKSLHKQQDALKAAQDADAREAAAAEVDSQTAANAATADAKRRRRNNQLALGDTSGGTLGGGSVLGAGSGTPVAGKAASRALRVF